MKPLLILLIALGAAATASAGSVITAVVNNGNWGTNSTWSLNRQPGNGDTVLIPANKTVLFNTDENLNGVLIRIYGVLNMNAGKKLNLDNVSVIRVYPGGTIMGTGSSDQIRIGSTHVFDGSEPDITGPMFADQTTGSGFAPMQVMPVTFVNFYVTKDKDQVKIYWSTATESNNDHFEVERSANGIEFQSLGNGPSTAPYWKIDPMPSPGNNFYRIKQYDKNGAITYSQTIAVRFEPSVIASVFPNPITSVINVRINTTTSGQYTVSIADATGRVVYEEKLMTGGFGKTISFNMAHHTSQVYIITVRNQKNEIVARQKVAKLS